MGYIIPDIAMIAFKKPSAPVETLDAEFEIVTTGQKFTAGQCFSLEDKIFLWPPAWHHDLTTGRKLLLDDALPAEAGKKRIISVTEEFINYFDEGKNDPLFHSALKWHPIADTDVSFTYCSDVEKNHLYKNWMKQFETSARHYLYVYKLSEDKRALDAIIGAAAKSMLNYGNKNSASKKLSYSLGFYLTLFSENNLESLKIKHALRLNAILVYPNVHRKTEMMRDQLLRAEYASACKDIEAWKDPDIFTSDVRKELDGQTTIEIFDRACSRKLFKLAAPTAKSEIIVQP